MHGTCINLKIVNYCLDMFRWLLGVWSTQFWWWTYSHAWRASNILVTFSFLSILMFCRSAICLFHQISAKNLYANVINNKEKKTSWAEQCQAQKSSARIKVMAYQLGIAQFDCNSRNIVYWNHSNMSSLLYKSLRLIS